MPVLYSLPNPKPQCPGWAGQGVWVPAAASALPALVKHRGKPRQALPHPAHPNGSALPCRKNPAISSQLCHETTPILGQRLPQAQLQPVPTGEAKPTAGARRAPAQHQHREQFRSILTPQPTRAGAQSPSWPPAKLRWGERSCRRGSTNPGQAQAPQSYSRL